MRIVGLSGNVKAPSRTAALTSALLDEARRDLVAETRHISLVEAAPVLFRALRAEQLDDEGLEIIEAIERADALIVSSPVYRASYTGALKHLFDLVDYRALTGVPVILAATGGRALHGLMPDQQLRPLMAFFKALPLPTTVYAVESDFVDFAVANDALRERIAEAGAELRTALTKPAASLRRKLSEPTFARRTA
ncbi:NAD(P)H-dependent oxidoreductase [Rhizobium sp. SG_E_25_P2]|uniref:NAD(P)H-dependent oxidoreductase n=1 Tax=Rhizobium sp. SG_E_25_P2 TaxID=2879942 RepID=UPI002474FECB|nr:NAD(P)H-dependent oxidoreductase [Rhizobium sp. SG_E_25_P2]